jgi:hypothetical protein
VCSLSLFRCKPFLRSASLGQDVVLNHECFCFHKMFLLLIFLSKLCNWIQNSNCSRVKFLEHFIICLILVRDALYVITSVMTPHNDPGYDWPSLFKDGMSHNSIPNIPRDYSNGQAVTNIQECHGYLNQYTPCRRRTWPTSHTRDPGVSRITTVCEVPTKSKPSLCSRDKVLSPSDVRLGRHPRLPHSPSNKPPQSGRNSLIK